MTRDEIYLTLKNHLIDLFEVPEEKISLQARLYEDLDMDSIDAVDLVVKLQELTGRKFSPDSFKTVRTVDDVVERTMALLNEQ